MNSSLLRSSLTTFSIPQRRSVAFRSLQRSFTTGNKYLEGKVALVTGSTSGIGLGIANSLASQGCSILFNGFGDSKEIDRLVQQTKDKYKVKVAYHGADLSKPSEIESMMNYANQSLGGVDILVNNAGIQHVAPVHTFPVDKWDAVIAINLSAVFHTIRLSLPGMKQKKWGLFRAVLLDLSFFV